MYPILIDFGRFKLHSYGLMLFLAFAVGIYIAYRRGRRAGLAEGLVLDISTAVIISGLIGARALYVLTHLNEFRGRWIDIISPIQSDGSIGYAGLVLLGGVLFALATSLFIAWLRDAPLLKLLDVFAPSIALGVGIGRIGCFLNGCCFGLPTKLPWGMVFPAGTPAGSVFPHQHIHPTQLYASIYGFALFAVLLLLERRYKKFEGYTFSLLLIGYGLLRFLNEMIRWYEPGFRVLEYHGRVFTLSQAISLALVLSGIVLYRYAGRLPSGGSGSPRPRSEE